MLEHIADGRTDLVFSWVDGGGAATAADAQGVSLIKWCAYYGDVSAIRFLLAHGERLSSLGENFDLNGAAFHGHWQLCQFLLENGADVNAALLETGETPLHAALCKANRIATDAVVKVLLGRGADPNRATKAGTTTGCFMRDCRTRGETPLHRAAAFGSEAAIGMLLDAGASLDVRDINGDSPLTWASWHLRPSAIMRRLCYGNFSLHSQAHWPGDHGTGWTGMDANLLGVPRPRR